MPQMTADVLYAKIEDLVQDLPEQEQAKLAGLILNAINLNKDACEAFFGAIELVSREELCCRAADLLQVDDGK